MARNINRIIAGKKSQAKGAGFESFIKTTFNRLGWLVIRVPNGARWVGKNKIIPTHSPFDFLAIKKGDVIVFDAKRTGSKALPLAMIKQHQADALQDCLDHGCPAGFIVHFERTKDIHFFSPDLTEAFVLGPELACDPQRIIDWFKKKAEANSPA